MNAYHFILSTFFAESELFTQLTSQEGTTFNYWEQFVHMMLSLGLLLSMILVTLWFLKKFIKSRNRILNRSAAIQILEKRTLSQKSFLYLIQIENKKLLISDSPAGPNMLCEIKNEEMVCEEKEEETPLSFAEGLKSKMKRFFVKNG